MAERERESSSGRKWLFGCAGGCLGLVIVVAAVVGIIAYYALRAVPIVPPETFLVADTDAFLVAKVSSDDTAIISELEKVMPRVPDLAGAGGEFRKNWEEQDASAKEAVASAGPLQIVLVQKLPRPDTEDAEPTRALALSPRGMSGMFRWLLNWSLDSVPDQDGSLEEYKGTTVATLKNGRSIAARGNNFLFADGADTLKQWIDRIEQQRQAEAKAGEGKTPIPEINLSQELKSIHRKTTSEAPVRFGVSNRQGQLRSLLAPHLEQEKIGACEELGLFQEDVKAIGGSAETAAGSDGRLRLWIACADAAFAGELAGRLKKKGPDLLKELDIKKLDVSQEDSMVAVQFVVPKMWSRLRKALLAPDEESQ